MAAKVLNIEICDQTIKVCRTARKGKGVRIFDSFIFPTPANCVSDGVISDSQLLGRELKKQLASKGLANIKNVIFSLSSSKVAAREVKLPQMKKSMIATAIRTNAEDYFPIELKTYHIAYCILESASSTKTYNRILVMAVPIAMLEGYFKLAENAGLTVKAIDSNGNSQYQALKSLNSKGVTVYVDVSDSSSIVSFMRDNKLLLQRTFAFGVDDLLSHYMSVSGKTRADYLEVLNETDMTHPDFTADKLLSLSDVQNDLSRIVNGIMRSVEYFNSSLWETVASRVVLVGLNRHVVGLRELVSDATGLETLYLDDIPDFAAMTSEAVGAPSYINCIGCSIAPLDLIPQQFLSSRKKNVDDMDASNTSGIIICGVIVCGAILISLFSWLDYQSTVKDLKGVQDEISSLEYTQQTFDYYNSYKQSEDAVNLFAAASDTPNARLVSFFEEFEQKMPTSILILSASCLDEGMSLNITVGSYTDAAAVIANLRTFESLAQINVSDFTSSTNEAGIERITFTVDCVYGTNPYLNKTNPYSSLLEPTTDTTGAAAGTAASSPAPSASPSSSTTAPASASGTPAQ